MPLKKILSFISLGIFLAAIITIILSFKGGSRVKKSDVDAIIGKGMSHKIYDENNHLTAEITSSSTQRDYDETRSLAKIERTLLTDIKAVIYKHGEFESDVKFSGGSGYVENGYNDFLIKDKARIESDEALFLSEKFFMEGSAMISNDESTEFVLKNIKGNAEKGLNYILKYRVLDLFKASGIFVRAGKNYNFSCNKLMILKKLNRIVFRGKSLIKDADSSMKGKEIILRFNDDFNQVKRVDILGKGHLFYKGKDGKESREISGKVIAGFFNDTGDIKEIKVSKKGIVNLYSNGNRIIAVSKLIYISFNPQTNKLSSVKLLRSGTIESKGKRPFIISSEKITIDYDKNEEIEKCITHGDTKFKTEGYNGSCNILEYFPEKSFMILKGEKSVLEKGVNRFVSPEFLVNTKEEKFSSDKEIRSTIQLESDNSIFSKLPVYVSSKKIEIDDKSGSVVYSTNVSLFQGDTKLNAEKVEIGENKSINISGKAKLNFTNNEKGISISGEEIKIDPDKNFLYIKGKGVLSEGDNSLSGESLVVEFNDNKKISRVTGEDKIEFKRKGISGKSEKVIWKFNEQIITFITNAQLIKADSGSSKGDEIKFYIEDEKVVIRSVDGKRSETKID